LGILEQQESQYFKSEKFKKALAKQKGTNSNFAGNSGSKNLAFKYGNRMKELLREEIIDIKSSFTGESFLDHIDCKVEFDKNEGWVVNINFIDNLVIRESLSPNFDEVYMPYIVNNPWDIKTNNRAYGYDRHGQFVIGTKEWKYPEHKGFMQRAVNKFNEEMKNKAIAIINENYK